MENLFVDGDLNLGNKNSGMKKNNWFIRLLYRLRLKKRPYGFRSYSYKQQDVNFPDFPNGDLFSNYALLVPKEAYRPEILKMDERGAPIFAECPAKGGLCACTGACRKVIGWSRDPAKIEAYQKYIEFWNEMSAKGLPSSFYTNDSGGLIWSHTKDKP